MRRRLTRSIVAVALLAVVLFGLPLVVVVQRFVDEQAALRLERHAVLASRQVPKDFATGQDPVELPTTSGISYGLYDRRGDRVAGAGPAQGGPLVTEAFANKIRQGELGETRVAVIPVVDREVVVGVVRASQPTAVADRRTQRAILLLGILGLGVVAIGAVIARVVAARLARPVTQLRDQAVRLGDGDFAIAVTPTGVTELDDAGTALVATATRLRDLVHRERAFSADASHQLRTPLAALRTNIETEIRFPRPEGGLVLTEALEDIARLEATIDQLLAFARTSGVHDSSVDVVQLLEELGEHWNGVLAQLGRPLVVTRPQEPLSATGSGALVRQAFDALLDNAVKHGAGEVRLAARHTERSVTIAISDSGSGFGGPPTDSTADPTAPHGYGLPLARRLVEANRGRLVIANRGRHPVVEVVLRRDRGATG